jgi:hypothetical protein
MDLSLDFCAFKILGELGFRSKHFASFLYLCRRLRQLGPVAQLNRATAF